MFVRREQVVLLSNYETRENHPSCSVETNHELDEAGWGKSLLLTSLYM